MSSTGPAVDAKRSKHIDSTRLITFGVLAVLAASAVNGLVLELALAVVAVPSAFVPLPLGWGPVVASSAVGAVGATVAYGVIARYSVRPNRTFTGSALVVWLFSYVNLLTPALSGAPGSVYGILGLMHVTSALTIVGILRQVPTRSKTAAEESA